MPHFFIYSLELRNLASYLVQSEFYLHTFYKSSHECLLVNLLFSGAQDLLRSGKHVCSARPAQSVGRQNSRFMLRVMSDKLTFCPWLHCCF